MAWFRVLAQSIINRRVVNPGEAVQYDGQPGKALKPMSDDEVKKHLDALDVPPTKSVEQRLDEIELTIGRDNIRKAVEQDSRLRARIAKAQAEKAEADQKASEPQPKADPNAEKGKAKAEA